MTLDQEAFITQVERAISVDPLPLTTKAIFIGIFSQAVNDMVFPKVYLSGSPEFDPDDESWACLQEGSWDPRLKYLNLPTISSISDEEWERVLYEVTQLVMASRMDLTRLLGNAEGRPVAVGWDGGDVHILFVAKK